MACSWLVRRAPAGFRILILVRLQSSHPSTTVLATATMQRCLSLSLALLGAAAVLGASNSHGNTATVSLSSRHAYGHLLFDGAVDGLEIFRATFGGLMPCGQYELVRAPDEAGLLCNATKETEEGALVGRFVFATRGVCNFFEKAKVALEAGAAGLILINNGPGLFRPSAGNLTANYTPRPIDMPVVMTKQANGQYFHHLFRFVKSINASFTPYREACAVVDKEARKAFHLQWVQAQLKNETTSVSPSDPNAEGATQAAAAAAPAPTMAPIPTLADTKEMDHAVLEALFNERAVGASSMQNDVSSSSSSSSPSSSSSGGDGDVAAGGRSGILKGTETADLELSLPDEGDENALGFVSSQEKALLEEILALNGHHEAVAAVFSGPMLREASLPVAFAEPFDACAPAEEEYEETVEVEDEEANKKAKAEAEAAAKAAANATEAGADGTPAAAEIVFEKRMKTITRKAMKRTSFYSSLNGSYAIVYRGNCSMLQKARNMEAAGAAGVIIVNSGVDPHSPPSLATALHDDAAMDCRYVGLCDGLPSGAAAAEQVAVSADGSAKKAAAVSLHPQSLEANGGKPGAAAAVADDSVIEFPVHIAVVMVPAAAGARWRWTVSVDGQSKTRSIADIRGLRLRLLPRTARGDGWLGLEKDLGITGPNGMRLPSGPTLPSDPYNRQQTLLKLLYRNHPASSEGHLERYLYVKAVVKAISDKNADATTLSKAGGSIIIKEGGQGFSYFDEFVALEDSNEWKEGVDPTGPKFLGRERHTATPFTTDAPSALFLMRNVPLGRLAKDDQEPGPLQCAFEGGLGWTVRSAPLELKASSAALIRRVADLLIQQACLEKWMLLNAASLGTYSALLRKEVSDDDWQKLSTALVRPYGISSGPEVRSLYAHYLELASRYELHRGPWPPHEGDKVLDWVEGTLHHQTKQKEEAEAEAAKQGVNGVEGGKERK